MGTPKSGFSFPGTKGLYKGFFSGLLYWLFRGIPGVKTIAHVDLVGFHKAEKHLGCQGSIARVPQLNVVLGDLIISVARKDTTYKFCQSTPPMFGPTYGQP